MLAQRNVQGTDVCEPADPQIELNHIEFVSCQDFTQQCCFANTGGPKEHSQLWVIRQDLAQLCLLDFATIKAR